jgi:hypothetical protein
MGRESAIGETLMCTVCENSCEETGSMTEQSIKVDEYSWICYDPGSESETVYLHE